MIKKLISSLSAITLLSGCASIVSGSTQEIQLKTNPSVSLSCEASNERGHYSSNDKPGMLLVKRSQSRLNINCIGDEYVGKYSEQAGAESWAFGNVILGGLVGLTIDGITGAMFSYDNALTVPVVTKGVAAQSGIPIGGKQDGEISKSLTSSTDVATTPELPSNNVNSTMSSSANSIPEPKFIPLKSSSYSNLVKSGAIVEAPDVSPITPTR